MSLKRERFSIKSPGSRRGYRISLRVLRDFVKGKLCKKVKKEKISRSRKNKKLVC